MGNSATLLRDGPDTYRSMEAAMAALRARERAALERMRERFGPRLGGAGLLTLESLEHDVGGLADLVALARALDAVA